MPTKPFDPASMPRREFVDGPDSDDGDVVIDRAFAKELSTILDDHRVFNPVHEDVAWSDLAVSFAGRPVHIDVNAIVTRSDLNPDFRFVEVEDGVLMVDLGGEIVGAYLGFDVALARSWRGQGLGAELVLERAMRDDGVPQWEASKIGYSPDGYRAHEGAWDMARDRARFARKAARLIHAELLLDGADEGIVLAELGAEGGLLGLQDVLALKIQDDGLDAVIEVLSAPPPPSAG